MAQLDSASDSDSDGWRFESVWVHQTRIKRTQETILGSFYFIEEIEPAKGGENFNKRF